MSTQSEKLDAVRHLIPENCTDIEEIAQAVHVPPAVLTEDKYSVSDVLFLVNGPGEKNENGLTPDEAELLEVYRSLSQRGKLMLMEIMRLYAATNQGEYGE